MTTEQIEWMIRRYRSLAAVKGEVEAEMAQIAADINDEVEVGWSVEVDGVPASKRNGRRKFNMVTAVKLLDTAERNQIPRLFDEKYVRALIEEKGLLEDCMEDAGRSASVVLR